MALRLPHLITGTTAADLQRLAATAFTADQAEQAHGFHHGIWMEAQTLS